VYRLDSLLLNRERTWNYQSTWLSKGRPDANRFGYRPRSKSQVSNGDHRAGLGIEDTAIHEERA